MSTIDYEVNFQPKQAEIDQIHQWMTEENKRRTGLIHDLSIVTDYASKDRLAIISLNEEAIGFVTWDTFKRGAHIVVAAVAAMHRGSGAGRHLMGTLFALLLEKDILAVHLECAPAISEKFWRKMGFKKMPAIDGYNNGDSPKLYKTLVDVQKPKKSTSSYVSIYKYGSDQKQQWPLLYHSGKNELIKPIITPVGGDWCIEVVNTELTQRSEKIKYFHSGKHLSDPFLIITEL